MKKSVFTLFLMVVSMGVFAQMQIWSNGTIIFSHNANDVDSISFEGSPVKVQATMQEGSSSIAGRMYTAHSGSVGYAYLLILDENNALITFSNSNNTVDTETGGAPFTPVAYTYDPTTKAFSLGGEYTGYLTDEGCMLYYNPYGTAFYFGLVRVK